MTEPTSPYLVLLESVEIPVSEETTSAWLTTWMQTLELPPCEVSVTIAGDELLHELNRAYRDKDKPTDVLSFPQFVGSPEETLAELRAEAAAWEGQEQLAALGDIAISWDQVLLQSAEYVETPAEVLCRLLCHGLLHLLGYDHELGEEEERQMKTLEEQLLGSLAASSPQHGGTSA